MKKTGVNMKYEADCKLDVETFESKLCVQYGKKGEELKNGPGNLLAAPFAKNSFLLL